MSRLKEGGFRKGVIIMEEKEVKKDNCLSPRA